jgi:hypothetical protein
MMREREWCAGRTTSHFARLIVLTISIPEVTLPKTAWEDGVVVSNQSKKSISACRKRASFTSGNPP